MIQLDVYTLTTVKKTKIFKIKYYLICKLFE